MYFQRYLPVVLDAVLGNYVKNIDPDALRISVWNGQVEVDTVELNPDGFPLPPEFRLVKGTLHHVRVSMPWTNLANEPVSVEVKGISLLLEVCDRQAAAAGEAGAAEPTEQQRRDVVKRKRATIEAIEKATAAGTGKKDPNQDSAANGWTQSFLFKLLVKLLDNVQVHVQHIHVRVEDRVSDPRQPFALGMTLESFIMKSADEGWNYTMVVRGGSDKSSTCLRKKLDMNKFGIYSSLPLVPVPASALDDSFAFAKLMQMNFWSAETNPLVSKAQFPSLFRPRDYIVEPLTMSIKLTVNDGNTKLPLTHQELSDRVISRLGTVWMVETIEAIGDRDWEEFVRVMPKLAGGRKYTLSFVYSEAWAVARDLVEEEDSIPSVEDFKIALSSCLQWPLREVERLEDSIIKYRAAVVHVMEEKSTYIDATTNVDQINVSLKRDQYLTALSLISFVSTKQRHRRYSKFRPAENVIGHARLWWQFAIAAVILDVRERNGRVDWEEEETRKRQRQLYKQLYQATQTPPALRSTRWKDVKNDELDIEMATLEHALDVKELLRLRSAARREMIQEKQAEATKVPSSGVAQSVASGSSEKPPPPPPASSRLWSYATWLTSGITTTAQPNVDSTMSVPENDGELHWSDQDTRELFDVIDFHPDSGLSDPIASVNTERHIWYRCRLTLGKGSMRLSNSRHERASVQSFFQSSDSDLLLHARLEEVDLQLLFRRKSFELDLSVGDAAVSEESDGGFTEIDVPRRFLLKRMAADDVLKYHPVNVSRLMTGIRLRHCEKDLPLFSISLQYAYPESQETTPGDMNAQAASSDVYTAPATVSIGVVLQAVQCNINLPFILRVLLFFTRPKNVNLEALDRSARQQAQNLRRFSASQLQHAVTSRTKVLLSLDMISPLLVVTPVREKYSSIPASSLVVFLGHLRAASDLPNEREAIPASIASDDHLYDVIRFSISGIEVQFVNSLNSLRFNDPDPTLQWLHLVEKTSLSFRIFISVAPNDPSITLLKMMGEVESVQFRLSMQSYGALMQLMRSFGENYASLYSAGQDKELQDDDVTTRTFTTLPYPPVSISRENIRVPLHTPAVKHKTEAGSKLSDAELFKLWKRMVCRVTFEVKNIGLQVMLQDHADQGQQVIAASASNITTSFSMRTYTWKLDFGLGAVGVKELHLDANGGEMWRRELVSSNSTSGEDNPGDPLVQVAATCVNTSAPLPEKADIQSLISDTPIGGPRNAPLLQDCRLTWLTVDACMRKLTVNFHQEPLAQMFLFFYRGSVDSVPIDEASELNDRLTEGTVQYLLEEEEPRSSDGAAIPETESDIGRSYNGGGQLSHKIGAWVASSLRGAYRANSPGHHHADLTDDPETSQPNDTSQPATIQVCFRAEGLTLNMHLESADPTTAEPFASLKTKEFCCCAQKFPTSLLVSAYLTSLKVYDMSLQDPELQQIVSHAAVKKSAVTIPGDAGHIPDAAAVTRALDEVPSVFTFVGQLFGADRIQEAWHPGYCNHFVVRIHSPRMRFLYRFVDDLRRYFFHGSLLKTVMGELFQDQSQKHWEGDFQLSRRKPDKTSSSFRREFIMASADVVSYFPLLDVQVLDAVIEMPPHRMSSEALVLRFDEFSLSNQHVLTQYKDLSDRVMAKVLLNSMLTQLKLQLRTLRVVSRIFVDPSDITKLGSINEHSVLGSTDTRIDVNLGAQDAITFEVHCSPVRFVCNQEQCAFLLRVPIQNFQERSRLPAAEEPYTTKADMNEESNEPQDASEPESDTQAIDQEKSETSRFSQSPSKLDRVSSAQQLEAPTSDSDSERRLELSVSLPEVSMEMLHGSEGYQPTSSGDLSMKVRGDNGLFSICIVDASDARAGATYGLSSGAITVQLGLGTLQVRDSRSHCTIAPCHRDLLVFNPQHVAEAMSMHFSYERAMADCESEHVNISIRGRSRHHDAEDAIAKSFVGDFSSFHRSVSMKSSSLHKSSGFTASRSVSGFLHSFSVDCESVASSAAKAELTTQIQLSASIAGFRITPSNIHYDIASFLERAVALDYSIKSSSPDAVPDISPTEGDPSSRLESTPVAIPAATHISIDFSLGTSSLVLVEDVHDENSRAVVVSWGADVALAMIRHHAPTKQLHDRLGVSLQLSNVRATAQQNDAAQTNDSGPVEAAADCLKEINVEGKVRYDFAMEVLQLRMKVDRVIELRFGYLDCMTVVRAIGGIISDEEVMRPGAHERRSSTSSVGSAPPFPMVAAPQQLMVEFKAPKDTRKAIKYGESTVTIAGAAFSDKIRQCAVGIYNSAWGNRYLVLPLTNAEKKLVTTARFRVLPCEDSKRQLGDVVCYGDRVMLQIVSQESPTREVYVSKYDQLGATGYLGPDGAAGVFKTTIWRYEGSVFNLDRGVVHDNDEFVLEELTLYRSFSKQRRRVLGPMARTGMNAQPEMNSHHVDSGSGGYLMFNGVGDAPLALKMVVVSDCQQEQEGESKENDPQRLASKAQATKPARAEVRGVQSMEFILPGVNATIVNDFNNMLLPLLHFHASMLTAEARGWLSSKFSVLVALRLEVQAYNSQLAVWEPMIEDFGVDLALHWNGGVVCEVCKGANPSKVECKRFPTCLFHPQRSEVFSRAFANAAEAQRFISRELLDKGTNIDGNEGHEFVLTTSGGINVNASRNIVNVLLRFYSLVVRASTHGDGIKPRLGPFIYVDNHSGIAFAFAHQHPQQFDASTVEPQNIRSTSTEGDSDVGLDPAPNGLEDTDQQRVSFRQRAWSRRRLSTMQSMISTSTNVKWVEVSNGQKIPTNIVAHEAPAGSLTSPLRRLLWLKPLAPTGKPIPVPIGYLNRSYLHLESAEGSNMWGSQSIICETVAEQGTLVLRLRSKVQIVNFLNVAVETTYNGELSESIAPSGQAPHFIPIQYIEGGTVTFRPVLSDGKLQPSKNFQVAALINSQTGAKGRDVDGIGGLSYRRVLTFYWSEHPRVNAGGDTGSFWARAAFQVLMTVSRKSERHETIVTLRAPITLENLLPYSLSFRLFCLRAEEDVKRFHNTVGCSAVGGEVAPSKNAHISEVDLFPDEADSTNDNASAFQPSVVVLTMAIPEIGLKTFSPVSKHAIIYGSQRVGRRIELRAESDESHECQPLLVCFEISPVERLTSFKSGSVAPVICRIFSEYWIVDRSDLRLSFSVAGGRRIFRDKSTERSHVQMLSFPVEESQPMLCAHAEDYGLKSQAFDVGTVGLRGEVLIPGASVARSALPSITESSQLVPTNQLLELGVMVDQVPGKFTRTKMVTFVPRYHLINLSDEFEIHIRQEKTSFSSGVGLAISAQSSRPFHWQDADNPKRIQVRFARKDSEGSSYVSAWTAPFELSTVGNFVLRVKKKLQAAPGPFKGCFEPSLPPYAKSSMQLMDGTTNAEEVDTDRRLQVSIEVHDPSVHVYMREEEDIMGPDSVERPLSTFVPYKIKNECCGLELLVWQKSTTADESGIGYEGPDRVLPFHTAEYIPYTFSVSLELTVQVRRVAGLDSATLGLFKTENVASSSSDLAQVSFGLGNECLASIDVNMGKLGRLPAVEVVDAKKKRRLWLTVVLDGTSKTLLVTDLLPGGSDEHKRRRRTALLRTWKRYNAAILSLSHLLQCGASENAQRNGGDRESPQARTKKRVHFEKEASTSPNERVKAKRNKSRRRASQGEDELNSRIVIGVQLVGIQHLEDVYQSKNRSDFTSYNPEVELCLKSPEQEARHTMQGQSSSAFPLWLPERGGSIASMMAMIVPQRTKDVFLDITVREADRFFGNSIMAKVDVHLHEYLAQLSKTSGSEVVDILVPMNEAVQHVGCGSTDHVMKTMFHLRVCGYQIRDDMSTAELSNPEIWRGFRQRALSEELDRITECKNALKLALEKESVEITSTTGSGSRALLQMLAKMAAAKSVDNELMRGDGSSEPDRPLRSPDSKRDSVVSATTDDTSSDSLFEEMGDEVRLAIVLINATNLQITKKYLPRKEDQGPKIYCTVSFRDSTRCAMSSVAKISAASTNPTPHELQRVETFKFPKKGDLGLGLVYRSGKVIVQGIGCAGVCGSLVIQGKLCVGDIIVAVNNKSIVNLHKNASFSAISMAKHGDDEKSEFSLSFVHPEPVRPRRSISMKHSEKEGDDSATKFDVEWNRRVEFLDAKQRDREEEKRGTTAHIRLFIRDEMSDHGLSSSQESSVVPFLYFFGDDATMDHLDHSKRDSRFDRLLGECWVPVSPRTAGTSSSNSLNERVCALYAAGGEGSAFEIIGELRLALKWEVVSAMDLMTKKDSVVFLAQIEIPRITVSIIDDGSIPPTSASSSVIGPSFTTSEAREVLCASISDQRASAGLQITYSALSDQRHVINARFGHLQVDNQLLETSYPVLLRPVRLEDWQYDEDRSDSPGSEPNLLPTFQFMTVFSVQPSVVQFDYMFAQMQEIDVKIEDAALVALAQAFSGVEWSLLASPSADIMSPKEGRGGILEQLQTGKWAATSDLPAAVASSYTGSTKVLLKWLLLCPIKINVTFTSTTDRAMLLSILSPDMSSALRTLISAAAALVSNLDEAPIKIPEFYVENLFDTTHTLAFYVFRHYIHHGLRSWYRIMGSVDFLGNPIGLVSTLGTGVKDFFYTPAQMLLEDENGLRIENLRTGMTKGSMSLLRNTAMGIFHTTGKITETLGKGVALLAMDDQYNIQRQRRTQQQKGRVNDLGDALTEGSKGLIGGVWDGIKGVVAAPVRGAEEDGAGGFVLGIGKGFAGLIVKPTAGFLDLLTTLSKGAKSSAAAIDGGAGGDHLSATTRVRLPRRFCSDSVLVDYSEREARGQAILMLTGLDATDDYVFHIDCGKESTHSGLVMLTDKRIVCLSPRSWQKLWEVALDSSLDVVIAGVLMRIGQTKSANKTYNIECNDEISAKNFKSAVEYTRLDISAARYMLLNMEKGQEVKKRANGRRFITDRGDEDESMNLTMLMENAQDTLVNGLTSEDLSAQPLRSSRTVSPREQRRPRERACTPNHILFLLPLHMIRGTCCIAVSLNLVVYDRLLSFGVYQIQVYGGPYQWTVFRRFSEFRQLYARLEESEHDMTSLPQLPSRTILPSTRDVVAHRRQESLSVFLQACIMHSSVCRSAVVLDFLTRDAKEVRVSLPPLSPTHQQPLEVDE
ncbi:TPA: LOW QUALITY PROTEIN: hypothetical protein N0F65_008719 [Lagenidium giganteum]|uniref:PX domain-containing protein n=1 Tax=Lagenidium giganteum TaxID=4803 RepID=A0AAV2YMD4_9STRA|nr:TPA: LOW QUALITY PROTEIN: hypothetical protein N0F65_008719 [Lagenidium giganteum]